MLLGTRDSGGWAITMSDKRQAREDCQRPFSIETLRKRVLLESTASENAEASSGETVMPVGADMVVVAQGAEAREIGMSVPKTRSGMCVQARSASYPSSHSPALGSRRRRRSSLPQLLPVSVSVLFVSICVVTAVISKTGSGTGQHGFIALRSAVTGAHTLLGGSLGTARCMPWRILHTSHTRLTRCVAAGCFTCVC